MICRERTVTVMLRWPYRLRPLTRAEIDEAVNDETWQLFRKSLKGLPTEDKLAHLENYLLGSLPPEYAYLAPAKKRTRVVNYINALKRGGQLNSNLEVVKWG